VGETVVREPVGAGEESVWDYPRPPRVEDTSKHVEVIFNGVKIADTRRARRVLETASPPVYYIPPEDIMLDEHFTSTERSTFCEWKGNASYYTITAGNRSAPNAAWTYLAPAAPFAEIAGYVAIYPALMDTCLVDGERVTPQPGRYYGGWVTHEIKGPFKGSPGSQDW
jgi:uncharacterized protein (DUF427 family)